MTRTLSHLSRPALLAVAAIAAAAGALALFAGGLFAQVEGERGIPVLVASQDIDVGGIEVNVTGDDAEDARSKAWRQAQREAWEKLGGPAVSDSQLQSMVTAIVIEREQIGPRRYVATLGVSFDRGRAGGYLGRSSETRRSAPMLLLPVTISAGSELVYEQVNPWQRAWAEYQPGASRVDYMRPSGTGGESLLLTYGQTGRRSRAWWSTIIDQYGAADILVPVAELNYTYPGGPVEGTFTARYGPDSQVLDSFTMTANSPRELPTMLRQAVARFDALFVEALADGTLRVDRTLARGSGQIDPAVLRLIERSRAILADREAALARQQGQLTPEEQSVADANAAQASAAAGAEDAPVGNFTVQFATPDAAAFDRVVSRVRGTPGVRGASIASTAIGGTSVMNVTFAGDVAGLRGALAESGFNVSQNGNTLSIGN